MSRNAARAEAMQELDVPGDGADVLARPDGLHKLRRACAAAEGRAFSLRRFHDRVLSFGSIPVPLIAGLLT